METFFQTLQPQTQRAYRRDLAGFEAWREGAGVALADLRPRHITAYKAHLLTSLSASSVNRHLSAVRSYLRFLVVNEVVPAEVLAAAEAVRGPQTAAELPQPLTDSQVERLLATPNVATLDGARDLAIIQLGLSSGMRLAELLSLKIEQLDWASLQTVVVGKGQKQRVVFFDQPAAGALVYYLGLRGRPSEGWLFTNRYGEQLGGRWVEERLATYGAVAGIPGLHPHRLRHTFATRLLDATGDLDAVSKLLGHRSARTTERYTSVAVKRLRAVYDSGNATPERLVNPSKAVSYS